MIDSITIFGKEIPLYGLLFYAGIAVAAALAFLFCKKDKSLPLFDLACSATYAMIGAMIGAKVLFVAVSIDQIIEYQLSLVDVIKGGFVFYGGFIGGFAGLLIYCKQFKMRLSQFADIYATVIPLGHAIGRVGCYFAGCCYGMPYDGPLHVVYHETVGMTPLETPLFPVQLLEAACLLVLFAILAVVFLRGHKGKTPWLYCIFYGVIRFVVEFFRGDGERGVFLGISTSQWISVGIIAVAAALFILRLKKDKAAIAEEPQN